MTVEEKCDILIAMLDEQKSSGKNQKSQQMDFSKIGLNSQKVGCEWVEKRVIVKK